MSADAPHPPMRSFGRLRGRTIKPRQAALMDSLVPKIAIDLAGPETWPATWLEIGFGGGEHMAAQAAKVPGVLVLGAEPFLNGAASALRHIDERGLKNVRLHVGDARDLLAALPDASLDRIFVMFPDPWPKARQQKRRLVQPETAAAFARVLKPGGRLRFATDVESYADWALRVLIAEPGLAWLGERADDWRVPPGDHVTTRYEEKRLGDIDPVFFDFERV